MESKKCHQHILNARPERKNIKKNFAVKIGNWPGINLGQILTDTLKMSSKNKILDKKIHMYV